MISLPVHTIDSAPEGSRETLADLKPKRGRVGNIFATLAESPALLNGYVALG